MRELEQRRQRAVAVTTDDGEVRAQLRQHAEPVTLFGRGRAIAGTACGGSSPDWTRRTGRAPVPEDAGVVPESQAVAQKEVFSRRAAPSSPRARGHRGVLDAAGGGAAEAARAARDAASAPEDPEGAEAALAALDADARRAAFPETDASVVGDERPVRRALFARGRRRADPLRVMDGRGAAVERRAVPASARRARVGGALDRRGSAPAAGTAALRAALADADTAATTSFMATASADGVACLWSASGKPLRSMRGHVGRCGRVSFFPSGAHLATAGFDKTWRLWDCETGAELLCQEGHSRAVYDVRFHPDGSLACSVGLEAHGRVWDVRSGANVLNLRGHASGVLCVDFAPNGAHVATGSEDHTVKVWDLRNVKGCLYTIPAHAKSVTGVRFEPLSGGVLLSSSHDGSLKAWSGADFSLKRRLRGHASRVAAADVAPGGEACVSVGHDRTLKLWRASTRAPEGVKGAPEAREKMEED